MSIWVKPDVPLNIRLFYCLTKVITVGRLHSASFTTVAEQVPFRSSSNPSSIFMYINRKGRDCQQTWFYPTDFHFHVKVLTIFLNTRYSAGSNPGKGFSAFLHLLQISKTFRANIWFQQSLVKMRLIFPNDEHFWLFLNIVSIHVLLSANEKFIFEN